MSALLFSRCCWSWSRSVTQSHLTAVKSQVAKARRRSRAWQPEDPRRERQLQDNPFVANRVAPANIENTRFGA